MKHICTTLLVATLIALMGCTNSETQKVCTDKYTLTSPDGNLTISFGLTDEGGVPVYELRFGDKNVIMPSAMGFELRGDTRKKEFWTDDAEAGDVNSVCPLNKNFQVKDVKTSTFDEVWHPVWGEESTIRNHYNELLVALEQF